ncbi:LysR substrate-binding domain-containing protein [Rhodocyclus tenuis]|uniref:LysR substrate-binding domain-containing protein n=1 Tax=Rhodocyclus tenuis TaxID=1066 RepID=UPI001907670A|nr:LysR family transcriptional regulator [Rhodocyclus tenuis]
MTLTELRYIAMLARERHFGRAAEKCHVSQPTLSVAVKKVEQRYGVILFERSATEVRPTTVGEQVAEQAERVLAEAGKLREITEQGRDPLNGPLRVGVIYTIAPYLLPRLIPALHRRAPRMPLYLQENFTANLVPELRRGDLDVIVIATPLDEAGIVTRAIYDEPFCVVLPPDHPLAAQATIGRGQIASEQLLLLGHGNCFRDQVVQACPPSPRDGGDDGAYEGGSLETVRHMVASGAGVSVAPASAAEAWQRDETLLVVRPFDVPAPQRRVVIAWRASFPRPPAIDVLYAAIADSPPPGVCLLPAPRGLSR